MHHEQQQVCVGWCTQLGQMPTVKGTRNNHMQEVEGARTLLACWMVHVVYISVTAGVLCMSSGHNSNLENSTLYSIYRPVVSTTQYMHTVM